MASRNRDEAAEVTETVPGKPASQVEAEAPPDAETAAAAEAEYESRMSGAGGIAPAAGDDES